MSRTLTALVALLCVALLALPLAGARHRPPDCPPTHVDFTPFHGLRCRADYGHEPEGLGAIAYAGFDSADGVVLPVVIPGKQAGVLVVLDAGEPKSGVGLRVCYAPPEGGSRWSCPVDSSLP